MTRVEFKNASERLSDYAEKARKDPVIIRNADVVRCKPGMIFSEIGLIPFLVPAHRRKRIPPMVRTLAAPCEV